MNSFGVLFAVLRLLVVGLGPIWYWNQRWWRWATSPFRHIARWMRQRNAIGRLRGNGRLFIGHGNSMFYSSTRFLGAGFGIGCRGGGVGASWRGTIFGAPSSLGRGFGLFGGLGWLIGFIDLKGLLTHDVDRHKN